MSPQSEGVLLVRAGFADAALEGGTAVARLLVTVYESDEIAAWLLVFGLVYGTSFGCGRRRLGRDAYSVNTACLVQWQINQSKVAFRLFSDEWTFAQP